MENTNENRRPGKQPENPRPLPPPQNPPPKCPRCDSINTKFCYYNNYSVSQPRYFCKTCRRYWTHGGALRNVPVGGSCRKGSKKSKAAGALTSSSCGESSTSTQLLPHQQPQPLPGNRNLANLPNSYLSSTGYLSSLAATMQSLSRPQGYNYNQLAFGGFGGSSGQIRCGSGQFSGGAATSSHSSLLQSFDNQHFRKHQPSNLNHYYFQQQQQHQQQHIYEADPHMLLVQQQNRKQTFILPQNRQIPSNPNSASNSRASVHWAQGMVVQQHQNNLSGPTEHPSMNNPNQWPDGDVEDLHGYGPPSPPS